MTLNLRSPIGWLLALALLSAGPLSAQGLPAQENLLPVSRTAGVLTVQLPQGKSTLVALPMVKIVASGTVAALPAAGQIEVTSSPAVLPSLTGPHAIKITSRVDQRGTGSNAPAGSSTNAYGLSAPISSITGQVVTATLATVPNVGDEFVIYQVPTIASIFGATNTAGLTGGATADVADIVYLGSAGTLVGYFYNTTASQWRLASNADSPDQGSTAVGSTGGVLVARKAGGASVVSLTLSGSILPGKQVAPVSSGFQVVNNPYSVATTLAASGLQNFINGGTGAGTADLLYIEQAGVLTGYYFKTGGVGGTGWRSLADNVTNQGAVLVAPGKAFLFKEQSGTAGFVMQEPFAE